MPPVTVSLSAAVDTGSDSRGHPALAPRSSGAVELWQLATPEPPYAHACWLLPVERCTSVRDRRPTRCSLAVSVACEYAETWLAVPSMVACMWVAWPEVTGAPTRRLSGIDEEWWWRWSVYEHVAGENLDACSSASCGGSEYSKSGFIADRGMQVSLPEMAPDTRLDTVEPGTADVLPLSPCISTAIDVAVWREHYVMAAVRMPFMHIGIHLTCRVG